MISPLLAQKEIKRPKNQVNVQVVDAFVDKSFDIYEKMRSIRIALDNGQNLSTDQIDIIQYLSKNGEDLIGQSGSLIEHADKMTILQQAKSLLQVTKAVKALDYSLAEATNVLLALAEKDSINTVKVNRETQIDPFAADPSNIVVVNESSSNEGAKINEITTKITLLETDYMGFKVLNDLLEANGEILEKKMNNGVGTFVISHGQSSFNLADLVVAHLGSIGYSIKSVTEDTLTVNVNK